MTRCKSFRRLRLDPLCLRKCPCIRKDHRSFCRAAYDARQNFCDGHCTGCDYQQPVFGDCQHTHCGRHNTRCDCQLVFGDRQPARSGCHNTRRDCQPVFADSQHTRCDSQSVFDCQRTRCGRRSTDGTVSASSQSLSDKNRSRRYSRCDCQPVLGSGHPNRRGHHNTRCQCQRVLGDRQPTFRSRHYTRSDS
jgi:hypothetical protein